MNSRTRTLGLHAGAVVAVLLACARAAPGDEPPGGTNFVDLVRRALAGGAPGTAGGAAAEAAAPPPEPIDPESVAVSDAGLIEIHVRDADITALLDALSFEARANIVTTKSVTGTVSVNLFGMSFDDALDAILRPNGFVYHRQNGTVFVGTAEELATFQPAPSTRVFYLKYVARPEAKAIVESMLGDGGTVVTTGAGAATGGAGGGSGGGGGGSPKLGGDTEVGLDFLVVTASEEKLRAVADLLAKIDVRPDQVLIEATILRATLNEDNQFGVDFTLLGGVDFQNVGSVSNAARDIATGTLLPEQLEKTSINVGASLMASTPEAGFRFGIVKNGIGAFVRALEEVTDVSVVANPKILGLNKQEAQVIVGRRDGYITTTVTETAAVQTVEFLETGTQIWIRPVIGPDGVVRLSVHPKDSNGGLTAANLPFEETTEAQATILVNDGHTVLIGGLFRERSVSSRGQVPVLGNIPLIGLPFQERLDSTVREEVIILLTVHVLKNTAEEADQMNELLQDVERIRVGARRGLIGLGRERLAQAYYQAAVERLEAGDREAALLNARMCLHNQPRHLAALRLEEQLLSERLWDDDGGRMRTFLHELIDEARDGDPAEPLLGRPRRAATEN